MRVVAEIPHERFKITVFSWNGKYTVRIVLDNYEQAFSINEQDVDGLDQVKNLVDQDFLNACFQRFLSMRNDYTQAFKRITP